MGRTAPEQQPAPLSGRRGRDAVSGSGARRRSGHWPRRLVAHLEQHPELDVAFGLTEAFVTPGEPRPTHFMAVWEHGAFPWHTTAMLARRRALDRVGVFDETLRLGEDIDWLSRARDAEVKIGHVDHVVLRYRVHSANATADVHVNQQAMLEVLRRSVQRRREHRAR